MKFFEDVNVKPDVKNLPKVTGIAEKPKASFLVTVFGSSMASEIRIKGKK